MLELLNNIKINYMKNTFDPLKILLKGSDEQKYYNLGRESVIEEYLSLLEKRLNKIKKKIKTKKRGPRPRTPLSQEIIT